jgi:hypothetical protein
MQNGSTAQHGAPVMSHSLFHSKYCRMLKKDFPPSLIDRQLRFDQWKSIQPIFARSFRIWNEETFYSILPTATQYSRKRHFCRNASCRLKSNFHSNGKMMTRRWKDILFEEEFI